MELTAVDILIMGASISTILGFIVAGITLRYLYLEKIEKLEYETKNTFLSGQVWTNKWESNNKGYFELCIKTDKRPSISIDRHSRKADLIKLRDLLSRY